VTSRHVSTPHTAESSMQACHISHGTRAYVRSDTRKRRAWILTLRRSIAMQKMHHRARTCEASCTLGVAATSTVKAASAARRAAHTVSTVGNIYTNYVRRDGQVACCENLQRGWTICDSNEICPHIVHPKGSPFGNNQCLATDCTHYSDASVCAERLPRSSGEGI